MDVDQIKANVDVFYKGSQLGKLDLKEWQDANSSRIAPQNDEGPALLVESFIENAPLTITNETVFTEVLTAMFFGHKNVVLDAKASVDVGLQSALGDLVVRRIPAEGSVPVKRS